VAGIKAQQAAGRGLPTLPLQKIFAGGEKSAGAGQRTMFNPPSCIVCCPIVFVRGARAAGLPCLAARQTLCSIIFHQHFHQEKLV
jgi:hypothetical protein